MSLPAALIAEFRSDRREGRVPLRARRAPYLRMRRADQHARAAAGRAAARLDRTGAGHRARLPSGADSVCRPRGRHGSQWRRAAGRAGCRHQPGADEPHSRGRFRERARRRRAGRDQPRCDRPREQPRLLLRAGSVVAIRVQHRRQRRGELRRRALSEVRLHDDARARAGGGAARRLVSCTSAARRSTRRATT